MYTILACTLIFAVAVRFICPKFDLLRPLPVPLCGGLLGAAVGLIIAAVLSNFVPRHLVEKDSYSLANMRTTEGTAGTFVFGCGSLHRQTTYRMLKVNQNGSLSPFSLQTSDNSIEIVENENLANEGWLKVKELQADSQSRLYRWSLTCLNESVPQYLYEFNVPKGTVRHEFNVQ